MPAVSAHAPVVARLVTNARLDDVAALQRAMPPPNTPRRRRSEHGASAAATIHANDCLHHPGPISVVVNSPGPDAPTSAIHSATVRVSTTPAVT